MLFIVILSIFIVVFSKANTCPTHRPCTTANRTNGTCVTSKECPTIYRLNGKSLTPQELDFMKKSVCGRDLDRSKLFCCDNNEVRRSEQELPIGNNSGFSHSIPLEEKVQEEYYHPTTPATTTTTTTTTTVKLPVEVVHCQTPNGEKAQCISIYQCKALLDYLRMHNTTESQKRFLKESVCGHDENEKPLICCGSDTNFGRNYDADRLDFKLNPLIPVNSCGFQIFSLPNRIFGGANSDLGEFPWTALLAYETHDGKTTFACGGSLISSRYVLTAAHCVSGQNVGIFANKLIGVRLGEWDYSNSGPDCVDIDGERICNEDIINVPVQSVHPHPTYQARSTEKYHDIALIRLDREVNFTNYIRPICLPNIDDYVAPGERLTISGWGIVDYNKQTTIKQKVQVPVVSRSQCSLMFERLPRLKQIGRGQFCAGGEPMKDACVGDSGAPLMRKRQSNLSGDPEQWIVEGIVSFGSGCGVENHYGVYTKVSEYLGWISRTIVL